MIVYAHRLTDSPRALSTDSYFNKSSQNKYDIEIETEMEKRANHRKKKKRKINAQQDNVFDCEL